MALRGLLSLAFPRHGHSSFFPSLFPSQCPSSPLRYNTSFSPAHHTQKDTPKKEEEEEEGVALYVHWPYCSGICNYCDFNRYLQNNQTYSIELEEQMAQGLVKQVNFFSALLGKNRKYKTLYFGGGTPSLALPETLSSVIQAAKKLGEPQMEVTMEVNPGDLQDKQTAEKWKEMGVTRLSLGIQSFRDKDLKILDRKHTAAEAFRACEIATEGFDEVSIDLIYGRSREDSPEEWRQELREALSLGAKHLSLYSLTLKPRTQLHKLVEKGKRHLAAEGSLVEMMRINLEETKRAGLNRYECSSYAVSGHECAHNIAYWTMGDYIGVGPGAYSRFSVGEGFESLKNPKQALTAPERTKRVGLRQVLSPQQWTKAVDKDGSGVFQEEMISGNDVTMERVLVGLRMTEGLSLPVWDDALKRGVINKEALHELVLEDLIGVENGRVRVSVEGFLLLDSVTSKLLV